MRGPLFSGAIGHPSTLGRLADLVRPHAPVAVLSTVWLARALAEVMPVVLLVEPDNRNAARRALRHVEGGRALVVVAGESLPLRGQGVGAIVLDALSDIDSADAGPFVTGLLPHVRPGGLVVALDATKSLLTETQLAGTYLQAGLVDIRQDRPREGAILTVGRAPAPEVTAVRVRAMGLAK